MRRTCTVSYCTGYECHIWKYRDSNHVLLTSSGWSWDLTLVLSTCMFIDLYCRIMSCLQNQKI